MSARESRGGGGVVGSMSFGLFLLGGVVVPLFTIIT